MGIKGLFPYIQDVAPQSIRDSELKRLTGYTVAIDASAWMYQFLSVVRTGAGAENLQNAEGEATSHIQGFLMRAVKMLEAGVHPIFVFDGKPPDMKLAVNRARREARAAAAEEHAAAVASETATAEQIFKAASRSTVVTRKHNDSAKALIRTMGIPLIEAPGEAEAACAQLCRAGKVYASVTEDMDVLTFGSPKQLKNLFDVEGSRTRQGPRPAREIDLALVLEGLSCDMNRFVEFCILAGCDYLPHLQRIGAKTAFQLLAREGSLQAVVEAIKAGKGPKGCSMPDSWDWQAAKDLFLRGSEIPDPDSLDLALGHPDIDALRSFLVEQHQFNASRIDGTLERLRKARSSGGPAQQRRIESFFRSAAQPAAVNRPIQAATCHIPSLTSSQEARNKRKHSEEAGPMFAESKKQQRPALEQDISVLGAGTVEHNASSWACSRCTFANVPELPFCEVCETPRQYSQSEATSSSLRVSPAAGDLPPCRQQTRSFLHLKPSGDEDVYTIDLDD